VFSLGTQGPAYDLGWSVAAVVAIALAVVALRRVSARGDGAFVSIASVVLVLVPWVGAATYLIITQRTAPTDR
jgi:hypothetical protein